jgi:hypothetical protein
MFAIINNIEGGNGIPPIIKGNPGGTGNEDGIMVGARDSLPLVKHERNRIIGIPVPGGCGGAS